MESSRDIDKCLLEQLLIFETVGVSKVLIYTVRHPFWQLSLKYSQNFNTETTWSCNMSYERKFCGLSEYVRFRKFRRLIKSTKWFKRDRMDFAYADLKSNFKFWGCLRPVWPLKSHISSFLFKYHIALAFFHLRLIRGHFAIDLILLQKPGFLHVDLWPQ